MAEEGRQFTTCPHCRHDTDIPTGFIVAWVAQVCIACDVPHVAPKSFSRREAEECLTRMSLCRTEDALRANTTERE